jgi:uncharacterized BrkB/YihY/UPF0761 family membrane protein
MSPIEAALRGVDRYQQRHALVGVPFAVVRKFGDDQGGNLATLLAWSAFFALLPLLLVLVTLLGYLLGRHPALHQRVLHSAMTEFPILGTQLAQNVHSLRANGFGLVVGIAGSLWGARGITQAGQYAMAEIWNIPAKERPSFWTRQARGLALLLVFALGLAATSLLTGLGSLGSRSAAFRVANLTASAGVNVAVLLLGFRVLTPKQIPVRRLVTGAVVAGIAWQGLLAAGGYLVGHNLRHATEVYGFFAVVLGLLSWAPAPEDHHAAFRLAGSPRWPPAGGADGCYPRRHPAAGARSWTVMVDRHQRTNRRGRSAECLGASPGTSCEEVAACSFSD